MHQRSTSLRLCSSMLRPAERSCSSESRPARLISWPYHLPLTGDPSYRKYYHHHVPILRTDTPASDLHSFLFWTIIIISSRLHPKYTQLHAQLLPSYRALLSETIIENVRDVEAIQAIILLCQWPLPVDRQWKDPSWTFCGLAVNAALQEGLHLPDLSLPSESTYHLHNTWIACFVTNTV